ncbi:MAG: hypothetical protein JOZ40_15635, partial [Methylobacteriaceae bacterium]|nr:hypothetical protein [Methylobacteriaceae bacterium]
MEASVVKLNNVPRVATSPRDKVRTVKELAGIAQQLRRAGKGVVQAHGTFDLL